MCFALNHVLRWFLHWRCCCVLQIDLWGKSWFDFASCMTYTNCFGTNCLFLQTTTQLHQLFVLKQQNSLGDVATRIQLGRIMDTHLRFDASLSVMGQGITRKSLCCAVTMSMARRQRHWDVVVVFLVLTSGGLYHKGRRQRYYNRLR